MVTKAPSKFWPSPKEFRQSLIGNLLLVAISLFIALIDPLGIKTYTDEKSQDLFFRLAAPHYNREARDDVVVALITDDTIEHLHLQDGLGWPFSPDQHELMLTNLLDMGVAGVVVDLDFRQQGLNAPNDKDFYKPLIDLAKRYREKEVPLIFAYKAYDNEFNCNKPLKPDSQPFAYQFFTTDPHNFKQHFARYQDISGPQEYPLDNLCDQMLASKLYQQVGKSYEQKYSATTTKYYSEPESFFEPFFSDGQVEMNNTDRCENEKYDAICRANFQQSMVLWWPQASLVTDCNKAAEPLEKEHSPGIPTLINQFFLTGLSELTQYGILNFNQQPLWELCKAPYTKYFDAATLAQDILTKDHKSLCQIYANLGSDERRLAYIKSTKENLGNLEPNALDQCRFAFGKMVFYGAHISPHNDTVNTPVSGILPGVFRHAVAFDNLLTLGENYIRPTPTLKFFERNVSIGNLIAAGIMVLILAIDPTARCNYQSILTPTTNKSWLEHITKEELHRRVKLCLLPIATMPLLTVILIIVSCILFLTFNYAPSGWVGIWGILLLLKSQELIACSILLLAYLPLRFILAVIALVITTKIVLTKAVTRFSARLSQQFKIFKS